MSNTTIYFLTLGDDQSDAESQVAAYLETENFFDCYNIQCESSKLLSEKRKELMEFTKAYDWKKAADNFLVKAEKHKADGNLSLFGTNLISAGVLYAQCLTIDTYIYNIDSGDYSMPDEDSGWWVIPVDFHY